MFVSATIVLIIIAFLRSLTGVLEHRYTTGQKLKVRLDSVPEKYSHSRVRFVVTMMKQSDSKLGFVP